jgi:hypothetical protein
MIGALNMFDVGTINAGTQAGMQRGAVNSPFTPLGQALKGTLDIYNKNRAAQAEQAFKMEQIDAQGRNALNVARAQKKPVIMPTAEQSGALREAMDKPKISYDDAGTGVVQNLEWDEDIGQYVPKWTPITAPDPKKAAIAAGIKERFRQEAEKEAARKAAAADGKGQGMFPFGGGGTAPVAQGGGEELTPADIAKIQQINAMVAQYKNSKIPAAAR